MSHKNRLHVFTVVLTIVGFLLNLGLSEAFATTMDSITPEGIQYPLLQRRHLPHRPPPCK